jgi:hypothetical protein
MLVWSWLLAGVLVVAFLGFLLDALTSLAEVEEVVGTAVRVTVLGGATAGGIAAPAALLWILRGTAVDEACRLADPRPAFTDRCPPRVLGLSAALWASAAISLFLLPRPVVPFFGRLVDGPAGVALLFFSAALFSWLGRSVYRLEPAGFLASFAYLGTLGLSVAMTFVVVDPAAWYRRLGYREEEIELLARAGLTGKLSTVGLSVAVTLATLAFVAGARAQAGRLSTRQPPT